MSLDFIALHFYTFLFLFFSCCVNVYTPTHTHKPTSVKEIYRATLAVIANPLRCLRQDAFFPLLPLMHLVI